jgi:transposase InsO family protein
MKKPSTYTANPEVPAEQLPRLAAIMQVLNGTKTVSEAARELNLARNHFQTILHRAMGAMIEEIAPKERGRPPKPQPQSDLEQRLKKLERENARLRKRVEATDELLTVAGQLLHGQRQPGREHKRSAERAAEGSDDAEPEGAHRAILDAVDRMHALGVSLTRSAALAGADASTLRRWRHTSSCTTLRRSLPARALVEYVEDRVRSLHGLIGASALSHGITGLTRRAAAQIKAHTLTLMERERQQSLTHVHVRAAGVVRGIDAMYLKTASDVRYALIAADASVPYRTSVIIGAHYNAELVAQLLEQDIEANGAPLVLRADRAKAHDAPAVRELLERHQILILHGPPRYPRFYGQLERQNREHRAWLDALADPAGAPMQALMERMLYSLNHLWPRKNLAWRCPAQAWNERKPISALDRARFNEEVIDRKKRLAQTRVARAKPNDYCERLAIEQTLTHMRYLQQQSGGRC